MKMRDYITNYLTYLRIEKNSSLLTIYTYNLELEKFSFYLNIQNINTFNLTTSQIRSYIYKIKEVRKLSPTSICKIIAILKSFFNYLMGENLIPSNPTLKIKIPKKVKPIPNIISKYEINRIIDSIKFAPYRCRKNYARDKLIVSMLYYTGIRRSELLNLNWDDLNLEKSTLIIRSGKGGKDRIIPIHPKIQELLDQYLNIRLPLKNRSLFIGENGKRLNKNNFSNLVKMYLKIAGLENKGYTAHSFRHSFATNLIEAGVDIFKVQKLLGHSSLDSTQIYVTFNSNQIAKAILNL